MKYRTDKEKNLVYQYEMLSAKPCRRQRGHWGRDQAENSLSQVQRVHQLIYAYRYCPRQDKPVPNSHL